jgi:Spirocyclase AveC-like
MATLVPGGARHQAVRVTSPPSQSWASPAAGFAAAGTLAIGFAAWILGRWAVDGGAHAVPFYGYQISPDRAALTWAQQATAGALVLLIGVALVRRSRASGRVSLDLAMFAGYFLCFWQDPISNFARLNVVFNHYALNVASWGPYIPWWHGPDPGYQAETILGAGVFTYALIILWVWLQDALTARIARWRPGWGWARLLPACFVAGVLADALIEGIWLNTGSYAYLAPFGPLTLFGGHWYEYPVLNTAVIVTAFLTTPVVVMRHNERAHHTTPLIFRGTEQMSRRLAGAVRILAAAGFVNMIMLAYMIVLVALSVKGGPAPSGIPGYLWPAGLGR